tara:strand:+ start:54133 stop:54537 length:405 start_codon:yes stop_codon:yes gene_type:complete
MFIKKDKFKKKEINLIPMINIIFLLLIFFMLTGTIKYQEYPQIMKPYSEQAYKESNYSENNFNLGILANGELLFKQKKINLNDLGKKVTELSKTKKILLSVHKNTKIEKFKEVLRVFKQNNFEKVYVLTTNEDI